MPMEFPCSLSLETIFISSRLDFDPTGADMPSVGCMFRFLSDCGQCSSLCRILRNASDQELVHGKKQAARIICMIPNPDNLFTTV